MGLILRKNTGNEPLTYEQLDGNFEYFTGSHAITGSLVVSGGITGSLLGTASTASYVATAQTASYVENAQTASLSLKVSGSIIVSELIPVSPSTGSMYFDATTPSIVIWDGTNWYSSSLSLL